MKVKLALILGIVGILLSAVACSAGPKQTQMEVSIDQFVNSEHIAKQVEVDVGTTLTVILGSNPSTGFQWTEQARIGEQTVLQQTGHRFMAPEGTGGTPPPPGAPGREEWTFKALKTGTTTVSMEYSRPWQGGEKGEWTFDLTVVVK